MTRKPSGLIVWLLLAAVFFVIALLSFFGVILADDMTGRLIYGVLWTCIGLAWTGRYFIDKKKRES